MNRNRTDDAYKEYTERYLAGMHPANEAVARTLLARRSNKGNQWSSNKTWAQALSFLEGATGRRPLVEVTPDEWGHAIQEALTRLSRGSMVTRVSFAKEFLRKALRCKDLPFDLDDALTVGYDEDETRRARILPDDEKRMLLEQIVDHPLRYDSSKTITEKVALQWYYDDTGFRCDEGRSVDLSQWLDPRNRRPDGGVKISLCSRREAIARGCRLKRGPREIIVYRCVKAVDAWAEDHPARDDPTNIPLFTGFYDKTGKERLSKQVLNNHIRKLGLDAGLSPIEGRSSPLIPHDYRHTRITQAAKQRPFNFPEFSMYFWGIPNSKEAATYTHLNGDDMATVARSNLGIDAYGYQLPTMDVGSADLAVQIQALQAQLDRLKGGLKRPSA